MLSIDPPRPPAGEIALEGLRLPGSSEGMPQALTDKEVDSGGDGGIFRLPLHVIDPGGRRED
jgi:hypothetical protein